MFVINLVFPVARPAVSQLSALLQALRPRIRLHRLFTSFNGGAATAAAAAAGGGAGGAGVDARGHGVGGDEQLYVFPAHAF